MQPLLRRISKVADKIADHGPSLGTLAIGGGIATGAVLAGRGIAKKVKADREWSKNAKDGDFRKIGGDIYVDRHGAMYPKGHPAVKFSMQHAHVIQFAAGLEEVLDTRLFRAVRPEDEQSPSVKKSVGGAVLAGGVAVGGAAGINAARQYANSPAVADRLSGLRATRPGFTQMSPTAQKVSATVSRAGSDLAGGVKSAAGTIGKETAYAGRGLYNAAESAGIGALKKAKPLAKGLLTHIGGLAAKIA